MSDLDDAFEKIVGHKADRIKGSSGYEGYIQQVLADHNIAVTEEAVKIFRMGAVDAMIFDVASMVGFTSNAPDNDDWASGSKRRELLEHIFSPDGRQEKHS